MLECCTDSTAIVLHIHVLYMFTLAARAICFSSFSHTTCVASYRSREERVLAELLTFVEEEHLGQSSSRCLYMYVYMLARCV